MHDVNIYLISVYIPHTRNTDTVAAFKKSCLACTNTPTKHLIIFAVRVVDALCT